MNMRKKILIAIAAVIGSGAVWGEMSPPPYHKDTSSVSLGGLQRAPGTVSENGATVYSETITVNQAPWLRLQFGDYNLGKKSYITIRSVEDGGFQRLTGDQLRQWNNASAFFNGDSVILELHAAEDEPEVFINVASLVVGERETGTTRSQCGTVDNRVASTDNRSGRIIDGCTAWLVSNGGVLTAGHCVDWDPDRGGPLLPDGVLDLWGSYSVNVPASDADGTINQSAPEDQFPIITTGVAWDYDGEGQGIGKDWAVFRINANANGQRAHIREGFHRMTRQNPAVNDSTRVTGFGVDTGTANKTLQTHAGPYLGEGTGNAAADIFHEYAVDTTGGNSGSPIIWQTPAPDYTIGIHTNAGCNNPYDGTGNHGTSFEVNVLEAAIQGLHGAGSVYVDNADHPNNPTRTGAIFEPFVSVAEAVTNVPDGGQVVIVEGSYSRAAGGNTFFAGTDGKFIDFIAPVGTVVIGY